MFTLRQIEANRRDSQKTTGPTYVTGEAFSAMCGLKILPSEKLADLDQLIGEYYQRFQPSTPEGRRFIDRLIRCEWTLRRLVNAEALCRVDATRSARRLALQALKQLQAETEAEPVAARPLSIRARGV